ncbi:hypothetical protein [Terrihabitans rhizophilus]|jgi:hypothetical protein|uniref:Uncharacterized protein n=1 Tax=Terrihabitans rhizophilus TaxID=3092662 RepID=A0ABU4RN85_9HYPH|nr:hypothetical protein [Terrihabitans sp. PJ23]MDX6806066.1 hypothetical protein [Terrihabitans sp. PJ23]
MSETTKNKLAALQERLIEAQKILVMQAAEADVLPSDNALRKIADLELTISAVEALSDES